MKRLVTALAATVVAAAANVAPAASQDAPSKQQLQQMYMSFLKDQGFSPAVDEDGDVGFKREGKSYFIVVDERDRVFFRVLYPGFWSIDNAEERTQVLNAANFSNGRSKVCKIYTNTNMTNTSASIEIYLPNLAEFGRVFDRSMSSLDNCVNNFKSRMK